MRVLVVTPLDPNTGYGRDGIGLADALQRHGLDVHLSPTTVTPPLPAEVTGLLTKTPPPTVDLLLVLGDPAPLPKVSMPVVAWTANYTAVDGWNPNLALGYDTGILNTLDSIPTAVVQPGFWPQSWPTQPRDWHSPLQFCTVGPQYEPALRAFAQVKQEHPEFADAELHIGLRGATETTFPDWVDKTYVHHNLISEYVRRNFYARRHVMLSPGGKDRTAIEFMSTGGLVIAPAAGTSQWLSSAYGHPVADFTEASLSAAMWHVHQHRADAQRKVHLASGLVGGMCGWDAVVERLFTIINEHLGDIGGRFLHHIRASAARTNGRG